MLLQGDSPGYIPCGVEIDLPGYHTPWGLKNWKNSANSKPKSSFLFNPLVSGQGRFEL